MYRDRDYQRSDRDYQRSDRDYQRDSYSRSDRDNYSRSDRDRHYQHNRDRRDDRPTSQSSSRKSLTKGAVDGESEKPKSAVDVAKSVGEKITESTVKAVPDTAKPPTLQEFYLYKYPLVDSKEVCVSFFIP